MSPTYLGSTQPDDSAESAATAYPFGAQDGLTSDRPPVVNQGYRQTHSSRLTATTPQPLEPRFENYRNSPLNRLTGATAFRDSGPSHRPEESVSTSFIRAQEQAAHGTISKGLEDMRDYSRNLDASPTTELPAPPPWQQQQQSQNYHAHGPIEPQFRHETFLDMRSTLSPASPSGTQGQQQRHPSLSSPTQAVHGSLRDGDTAHWSAECSTSLRSIARTETADSDAKSRQEGSSLFHSHSLPQGASQLRSPENENVELIAEGLPADDMSPPQYQRQVQEQPQESLVGKPGYPPARPCVPQKTRFTDEDDETLKFLKEKSQASWKQIAEFFPGRQSGTLQVRYCTKLKPRDDTLWNPNNEVKLRRKMKEYKDNEFREIAKSMGNGLTEDDCREKAIELGLISWPSYTDLDGSTGDTVSGTVFRSTNSASLVASGSWGPAAPSSEWSREPQQQGGACVLPQSNARLHNHYQSASPQPYVPSSQLLPALHQHSQRHPRQSQNQPYQPTQQQSSGSQSGWRMSNGPAPHSPVSSSLVEPRQQYPPLPPAALLPHMSNGLDQSSNSPPYQLQRNQQQRHSSTRSTSSSHSTGSEAMAFSGSESDRPHPPSSNPPSSSSQQQHNWRMLLD